MEIKNESDGNLNNPQQWKKAPTRMTSVNINANLHDLAKQNNISLRDAIEFGIHFLVADKDEGLSFDYPSCKLQDKLFKIVRNFQAKAQECQALRDQMDDKEIIDIDAEKDINNIFGGKKDE